jgi:hypothetical protein
MTRIRVICLASLAVFVMSAVATSGASAAFKKVWEVSECKKEETKTFLFTEGKCETHSLTHEGEWEILWKEVGATSVAVDSSGKLKLASGGVEIECEGTDSGTVGEKGLDLTSTITATKCKTLKGTCEEPKANPVHLPWHTQLVESGTQLRDLLSSDGAGNPGWDVECKIGGFFKVTVECTAADGTTLVLNNIPNDTVETTFEEKTEEAECHGGTSKKGTVRGTVTNLGLNSTKEMVWLRAV